jgi:hypothetical protein
MYQPWHHTHIKKNAGLSKDFGCVEDEEGTPHAQGVTAEEGHG